MSEPQDMTPDEVTSRRVELARIVRGKGPHADILAAIIEDNTLAGHGSRTQAKKLLIEGITGKEPAEKGRTL